MLQFAYMTAVAIKFSLGPALIKIGASKYRLLQFAFILHAFYIKLKLSLSYLLYLILQWNCLADVE